MSERYPCAGFLGYLKALDRFPTKTGIMSGAEISGLEITNYDRFG